MPREHKHLSPEQAAQLIKQDSGTKELTVEEIAAGLRDHVEVFGPGEIEVAGNIYTVTDEQEDDNA